MSTRSLARNCIDDVKMLTGRSIDYADIKDSLFTKNLLALSSLEPEVAHMLNREPIHEKLRLFYDDRQFINAIYLLDRQFTCLFTDLPSKTIPRLYDEWLSYQKPVLAIGVALGYGVKYLLEGSKIPKIYLYERDRSLLKVALTINDLAADILTQRLIIVPQEQIDRVIGQGIESVMPDPLLFLQNKIEYATLSRMISRGQAAPKRAVIFSGTLFTLDCATTLFDEGWDVLEVDPSLRSAELTEQLLTALNPGLLLKINILDGIERFARNRVVVQWEIDPFASAIPTFEPSGTDNLFLFTHNRERIPAYEARGIPDAQYLPLCANIRKFHSRRLDAATLKKYGCEVSFVGSFMSQNYKDLLEKILRRIDEMAAQVDPNWKYVIDWITAFIANPGEVSKKIAQIEGLKATLARYSLPEDVSLPDGSYRVIVPLEEFLSYLWRKEVIHGCLQSDIHLWGGSDWGEEFPDNYYGMADHYLDLPKIYAASKINLDIARLYQPKIVTMRVFDVLAGGGFVLADRNEALLEIFEEDWDIVCYDTPEEAADKISYYLKHDRERRRVAERGNKKVVQSHTFSQRLQTILQKVGLDSPSTDSTLRQGGNGT